MNYTTQEWLNLAFRWTHVFAGILWIGATWYFTWLDRRFHTGDPDEVWMVHSGGFYQVKKTRSPSPAHTLHWFKWEAAFTWLSGLALLILVYYFGGLMTDGDPEKLSNGKAIAVGIATIFVGWILYDKVLARNGYVALAAGLILIMVTAWALGRVMASRAAFMHVGALLGTLMAANVWDRIIPAQKQMVRAAKEGGVPDQRLADTAKNRSKHNTYLIMPVVLIMISNHFPISTYGNEYGWAILGGLTVVGWGAAHVIRNH
ncbi:MAG TPA: urate hydroxylase PuuD [Thermoanaerobaculia bacterium]|nr:urate hydroxylase PuuD [Thermoanaerobaculia bacterium]